MGLLDFLSKRRKADETPSASKKPRGILPDAVNATDVILIKCCPDLRPTHEIRLATLMAQQTQRKLRLILTAGASAHSSLTGYASQQGVSIEHRP